MNALKELECKSEDLTYYEDRLKHSICGPLKFNQTSTSYHLRDFITQAGMIWWNVFHVAYADTNGKKKRIH